MNVSDVKVTDDDSFVSNSMMIKAKNIIMKGANLDQWCDQRDHV